MDSIKLFAKYLPSFMDALHECKNLNLSAVKQNSRRIIRIYLIQEYRK